MPKFSSDMPTMENVFKHHPRPEVRQGLLKEYRLKATEVLQVLMPETIIRLQSLVGDIENPESIFWRGQVETGPFLAKNIKLQSPTSHSQSQSQSQSQKKVAKQTKSRKSVDSLKAEIDADGEEAVEAVGAEEGEEGVTEEVAEDDDDDDEEDEGDAKVASARLGNDKHNPKDDAFAGVKPGTSWDHVVATNPIQAEVIKIVRGEGENLYEQLNTLRVWLSLETPLIEDGNSFGADVQSHLVEQVDKYFTRTGAYVNGCNRHYHDRMIIVRRWVQMPNMPDFAEDLAASDRMDHQLARAYVRNMLLACGSLLGNFEKNWAKVINPKGSGRGGEAMY